VKGTSVLGRYGQHTELDFTNMKSPQGDTWATISAGREIVVNSKLGEWITTAPFPDYQLRLV
jgi:hypothetical protein